MRGKGSRDKRPGLGPELDLPSKVTHRTLQRSCDGLFLSANLWQGLAARMQLSVQGTHTNPDKSSGLSIRAAFTRLPGKAVRRCICYNKLPSLVAASSVYVCKRPQMLHRVSGTIIHKPFSQTGHHSVSCTWHLPPDGHCLSSARTRHFAKSDQSLKPSAWNLAPRARCLSLGSVCSLSNTDTGSMRCMHRCQ